MHGPSVKLCVVLEVYLNTSVLLSGPGLGQLEVLLWEVLRVAHMFSKTISYDTHLVKTDQTHSCSHRPMSIHRWI